MVSILAQKVITIANGGCQRPWVERGLSENSKVFSLTFFIIVTI